MAGSSKTAIYAALVGNSLIAVTKFAAATITGSSAMFSEGIHSLVDTGNQVLLLHGLKQAEKPPDAQYPFGHGKEVYFWSFVVAILIFGLGAGISVYQGWHHLSNPAPMTNLIVNYLVLGAAIVFEGGALYVAIREFNRDRGEIGVFEAVRHGKDPSLFVVVFEDSAAMLGLLLALAGIALYQATGDPIYDALASISIGVVLALTAMWLAFESKGLWIGESAAPDVEAASRTIVDDPAEIANINEIITLHMGPEHVIATLSLDFVDGIDSAIVESTVSDLNKAIKTVDPRILRVFIEAEREGTHAPALASDPD